MSLTMKEMIKKVQVKLFTRPDGSPGRHTWSCFYLSTVPKKEIDFPYSIKAFGNWLHITDPSKVRPFNPGGKSLKYLKNTVSGSFSYSKQPISIMISNGKMVRRYSCHYWLEKPETVLWYKYDGTFGTSQVIDANKLPNLPDIKWAIGGAGLLDNNPSEEGFVGPYADVWRKTSHIIFGFDEYDYFNAIEIGYMNKYQALLLLDKLGIKKEKCVWVDGGHVTASNVDGHTRNLYTSQYYAVSLGG